MYTQYIPVYQCCLALVPSNSLVNTISQPDFLAIRMSFVSKIKFYQSLQCSNNLWIWKYGTSKQTEGFQNIRISLSYKSIKWHVWLYYCHCEWMETGSILIYINIWNIYISYMYHTYISYIYHIYNYKVDYQFFWYSKMLLLMIFIYTLLIYIHILQIHIW